MCNIWCCPFSREDSWKFFDASSSGLKISSASQVGEIHTLSTHCCFSWLVIVMTIIMMVIRLTSPAVMGIGLLRLYRCASFRYAVCDQTIEKYGQFLRYQSLFATCLEFSWLCTFCVFVEPCLAWLCLQDIWPIHCQVSLSRRHFSFSFIRRVKSKRREFYPQFFCAFVLLQGKDHNYSLLRRRSFRSSHILSALIAWWTKRTLRLIRRLRILTS